jgi:maltooligosyltrehalose trehalohydrolase
VPDPMDPATVERSRLDWSELAEPKHRSMYDLYRALIALRRTHPELSAPALDAFDVRAAPDDSWLALHRGSLRLLCNLSPTPVTLDASGSVLLASADPTLTVTSITLPPESFTLLDLA